MCVSRNLSLLETEARFLSVDSCEVVPGQVDVDNVATRTSEMATESTRKVVSCQEDQDRLLS